MSILAIVLLYATAATSYATTSSPELIVPAREKPASRIDFQKWSGQRYNLWDGPSSSCPQNVRVQTIFPGNTLEVIAENSAGEMVEKSNAVFIQVREIQKMNPVELAASKNKFSTRGQNQIAYLDGDRIFSTKNTPIDEDRSLITNTELVFQGNHFLTTRWSTMSGEPLPNRVQCVYRKKRAHNIAKR